MPSEPAALADRLSRPAVALAAGLAGAVALAMMPQAWTAAVKGYASAGLRPGQEAALAAKAWSSGMLDRVTAQWETAERLAQLEEEARRLRQENRRLAAELTDALCVPPDNRESEDDAARRLVIARSVRARVLGQQARAFLGREGILDVGAAARVEPGDWVVESPAVLDYGQDAQLESGQLVFRGGRVWGKIAEVGPYTSTVRRLTEPGYRDVVRLAGPDPSGARLGPEGILEGTGEPLVRVRMIEVTEPVSVGDAVYAAGSRGLVDRPLLYGRVVRLERPAGAAHWDIWVEPAAASDPPEQVNVLRMEVNPLRLAGRE